jgi:hypothetical protein
MANQSVYIAVVSSAYKCVNTHVYSVPLGFPFGSILADSKVWRKDGENSVARMT